MTWRAMSNMCQAVPDAMRVDCALVAEMDGEGVGDWVADAVRFWSQRAATDTVRRPLMRRRLGAVSGEAACKVVSLPFV